jgi:hypothetical protein
MKKGTRKEKNRKGKEKMKEKGYNILTRGNINTFPGKVPVRRKC